MTTCSKDLNYRGIIDHISHDEIYDRLDNHKLNFYAGYDPTAKSLQIGNLFVVLTQMRLQRYGHRPFVLIGGATGMIGDPSGKSAERNLQSEEALQENVESVKKQLNRFLDFESKDGAVLLNNSDWMSTFSFLGFLRDVGKRFRLSDMLAKDSVKSRLSSESGISYTEFSYQMIQAYDFAYLNKNREVSLQIGGTDQWGNITAGIDLTRKLHGNQAYGLVIPLVTDAQGNKFGKSVGGQTIYLDPDLTSPYQIYQYLLNSDDSSVVKFLKYYTFLNHKEIRELEKLVESEPHRRAAQKVLASEVTKLVHGDTGLLGAERATAFFFGGTIENITDKEVSTIFCDIQSVEASMEQLKNKGHLVSDLLAETPLFKSKSEVRRSIEQKGVYINNKPIDKIDLSITSDFLASETCLIIRKGKKNYCVVKFI